MTQGKPRDARKEHEWRQWIAQWRASGLSVRAFCARHGLSEASFYGWRRELPRRGASVPAFVPVRVVADDDDRGAGAGVEVVAGGRTIRVAPGFDAATLRAVLAVLEGESC